jgi:phosphoglycolate phosphatase
MLLLFDIDGTLLNTNGIGRRAVEEALSELVGADVSTRGITFSGKTDQQIIREVLTQAGVEEHWLADRFLETIDAYERAASALLSPEVVTAIPGAVELVRQLAEQTALQLALLTGNIRTMAYRKVAAIGLDAHFPFGAFGCDSEDRNALPAIAVDRALAHCGRHFPAEEVVVIGDTPRDIDCARNFGARSIAVPTGRYDRQTLEDHGPDVLLDDLRDVAAFARALSG